MTIVNTPRILVLGATGKTGARVSDQLKNRGVQVVRAARKNADVQFEWSDRSTFAPALKNITGVYLIAPVLRTDFAPIVSEFLDEVERAGVQHVTFLSAYGMEFAPPQVALRAVELDLAQRKAFTHSIIRPAWFMQNFSENFLRPVRDMIIVPCGKGTESFVSVDDIAAVAVETLANPGAHACKAYSPTGPEALTFDSAARTISSAVGRQIKYFNINRDEWIDAMRDAGVPTDYGAVLRLLTETVESGNGSKPNNDVFNVTGLHPISFETFAHTAVAAW